MSPLLKINQMSLERQINSYLREEFGTTLSGIPSFRVAWSDSQTEIRKGTFERKYKGIYLDTVTLAEERKKYPLIKERWILEKLVPPHSCYTDEIVSAKETGSYECIYIFQDVDSKYLPLNQEVARIIVTAILNPNEVGKRTDSSELAQFTLEKKEEMEVNELVKELYEEALRKDMKYPDGTRANLHTDGMKIFIP